MRLLPPISPDSPVSLPVWFAVLGAPLAWTAQFSIGYWLTEAQCSQVGRLSWDIEIGIWMIPLTAFAALLALAAGLTALALFRRTRDHEYHSPPPQGRIHFLSIVGMTVAPLFLAMIALTALGVLIHVPCSQS